MHGHFDQLLTGPAEHGAPAPVRHTAAQGYAHVRGLRSEVRRLARARLRLRLLIGTLTGVVVALAVTAIVLVAQLAPAVL